MYGWTWDIRIWVAFFVHDLGYWGKPNMDGEEGELHPYFGAKLMHKLFDRPMMLGEDKDLECNCNKCQRWYNFTLYHSRFLAKKNDAQYSKLCVADKYAIVAMPNWLYIPLVLISGEVHEYLKVYGGNGMTIMQWRKKTNEYMKKWCYEHREIKEDVWTKEKKNMFV